MVLSPDNVSDGTSGGGILAVDAFFEHVDGLNESEPTGDSRLGIAYLRLMNMGDFTVREGMRASDEVVDQCLAFVAHYLGTTGVTARYGGVDILALVSQFDLAALVLALSEELVLLDKTRVLQLKVGYCRLGKRYRAHQVVERARFALEDTLYMVDKTITIFDDMLVQAFDKRQYVVNHFDDAARRGEIGAYAQPIVRIVTGRVCEVEMLARWESELFGDIAPTEFVPMLEQSRQVHKLDATIVRLACAQWREAEDLGVSVPFGVNLSRLDFELCDIYRIVREAMREYDVPVDAVHIEITESAETGKMDLLRRGIRRFREAGFKVYMDDYGTGYSSLAGLMSSDYDLVKLDKSLVDEVVCNERSRVIVADAVNMTKRLGMQTLCEGIETLDQLIFLRSVGCEKGQGYFFGRPADHEETMARLTREAERHEESGFGDYLDRVGRVNLVDGTRVDVQGVEASVFQGGIPVAVVEVAGDHIFCLSSNPAFDDFMHKIGASSFVDVIRRISAGEGSMRKRIRLAAERAKERGDRQSVDFMTGGFFSTLSVEHVAGTGMRDAYVVRASSIASSDDMERERSVEQAAPFLLSIYKRIDLFDLEAGTSQNLYLNAPMLASYRTSGITIDEIREFCDRNVHPADHARFMDFYDLSTLEERVQRRGGHHDAAIMRVRVGADMYVDHRFTLIPMAVEGRAQVLSTVRGVDEDTADGFRSSGDARISDATLLNAVLEGIDRYVFWKDDQRRFLGANQAFLDYYGFGSVEEIVGKTDDEVGWHVDNRPFRDDELRVLAGEVVQRARGTCYNRNELRYIEANKRPIVVSGQIVGLLGYFRDLGPAEEEFRPL